MLSIGFMYSSNAQEREERRHSINSIILVCLLLGQT